MSNIKIKTDQGLFLTEVPAVNMTTAFGSDLTAALNTIDENFKKIISLPFLKGDPGNSLSEAEFRIHDDTKISDKLKNAVITAIGNSQTQYEIGGKSVFDYLSDNAYNPSIKFYRMRVEENEGAAYKYVAQQMFLFVDARVPKLCKNMSSDVTDNFEDMSCGILFTGSVPVNQNGEESFTSASFTCSKFNVFPSLYFDKSAKRWCWKLNDFRTGVNAQGVDGASGQDAAVQICRGTLGNEQIVIHEDDVLQPEGESPRVGALTGVWFNDSDDRLNFTVGVLKEYPEGSPSYYYIDYIASESAETEGSFDFRQMLSTITLAEHLDNIANEGSTPENPEVRGLYVPDSNYVHMFWASIDPEKEANLGVVTASQRTAAPSVPIEPDSSNNTVLNAYYSSCIFPISEVKIKKTDRVTVREYRDYIATQTSSSVSNTVAQQSADSHSCINLGGKVILGKDISNLDDGKIYSKGTEIRHSEGSVLLDRETVKIGNISYPLGKPNKTDIDVLNNTVNLFNTVADFRNSGIRLFDSSAVSGKMHIGQIIKNNQTEYIYDFKDEITNSQTPEVDNSRPRAVNYVPVKISGYNTVYRYQNDNGSGEICTNHRYPIEMTASEIRDYAFLSGKTGYTAMLEFQGDYNGITHISDEEEYANKSILTSYNALWTKIGNVVDVKGKICFSVVPYTIVTKTTGEEVYVPNKDSAKPMTYEEFYKLMRHSGHKIAFPLPVVKKLNTSRSEFSVSVGNAIRTPYIIDSINAQTGSQGHPNNIISNSGLKSNDFYDGTAQVHLFGMTASNSSVPSFLEVEQNPAVFPLNCTIGKSLYAGDRFWDFKCIPCAHVTAGVQNNSGPVSFVAGSNYEIRPTVGAYNDTSGGSIVNFGIYTNVSNYYIRHITFSFSYLLDDDTSYNGDPIDTDIWTQVNSNTGGMGISIQNNRTEIERSEATETEQEFSR